MDFIPRAFAIRYCDILNNMVLNFFQDHADFFSRNENGYVFSGKNSKTKLTRIFSEYFMKEMEDISKNIENDYADIVTKHVYIIQGTSPENNVLKNPYTGKTIPSRYSIEEKDIFIDFVILEKIWNNIFDKRFKIKQIKGRNNGIVFLKNQYLNAEQITNILKLIYGEINSPYFRKRNVLEDISETTTYEFDGSKTMHDKLKLIVSETKDYVKKIRNLSFDTI